jgi:polyisoprenoid-binding protein YceI
LLVGAAGAQAAEALRIEPAQSEVVIKVFKEGVGKGLAHDHVVVAQDVTGTVSGDPQSPETMKVSVMVKTASLLADDPSVRRRYGQQAQLKESDRKSVNETMMSERQLDADRYPTISFVSTRVRRAEGGYIVTGQLNLHGQTREVSLPLKLEQRAGAVVADGTFKLRTTEYGIKPYSAALGTIRNGDQLELLFHITAR